MGQHVVKSDLVAEVATRTGITKVLAEKVIEACLATISEALESGKRVKLVNFGTFKVCRSVSTGALKGRPDVNVPKFTAGKGLRDKVNG